MKVWVCTVCGWIYDEAKGDPDYDLAPGVPFADLPDDFVCPLCGVGKDMFEEQAHSNREGEPLGSSFSCILPDSAASYHTGHRDIGPSISRWNCMA